MARHIHVNICNPIPDYDPVRVQVYDLIKVTKLIRSNEKT